MVFALFFVGLLYSMAIGRFPGILAIIAAGILLSNVRAAFLASEWRPTGEEEDKPTRFNETLGDKLAN
jgi:NhaP-type Na+/H+ or K+/H+ antiporter